MTTNGKHVIERVMPRTFDEIRQEAADRSRLRTVREMIGRSALVSKSLYKSRARVVTVDRTRPDYEFWDKLRRGKASGYALGGLFCKRIESIFASWTLGGGFAASLAEGDSNPDSDAVYTDGLISSFITEVLPDLQEAERNRIGLGDQYIIVNPDGSLSMPSPDTVEVETNPLDYRDVLSYTVTTKLEKFIITDQYREDGRTVTIKEGGQTISEAEYRNLIGVLPVVHIPNERSNNEVYGHPLVEALRPAFSEYDDVIFKQMDGVKLMGNPWPVLDNIKDVDATVDALKTAEDDTYTDKDGNTATREQARIDETPIMVLGSGSFDFKSPQRGFTEDLRNALKSLFLLVLDYTGIPEFIWGGEMGSSRSSTETQMDQFVSDIEGRQQGLGKYLKKLIDIWLRTMALVDGRVVLGDLIIEWPALVEEDEKTKQDKIEFALREGLIRAETALRLLDLVDDPADEVQKAREEAEERRQQAFPDGDTVDFNNQIDRAALEAAT